MIKSLIPEQNNSPNFIGSWLIPPDICDELVLYFENHADMQHQGTTGLRENISAKDSTDICISPKEIKEPGNEIFIRYFNELHSCYKRYNTEWPFLKLFKNKLQVGRFNLQRYKKGQHFKLLHTERGSIDTLHRVFAWMTYLNDVDASDGGGTYFSHYDLEVQPKKGLTLIWPAEWTHAHEGRILRQNEKYIITGWFNFSIDTDDS